MKRSKKICYGLLLALFIMVGLSLNVSSDVNAVSDLSFDIYKSDVDLVLCYNNDSTISPNNCSDYSYLAISSPYTIPSAINVRFYFGARMIYTTVFSFTDTFYIPISGSFYIQFDGFVLNGNQVSSSDYFTVTLTDSLGSCPEIEPCPVVPEEPYHDDLVSINNSILIVAAVGLVIYFFYAIYRMILGGRS